MKRLMLVVVGLLAAGMVGAQAVGPTVYGKKDGNNYNENLPMASGAGAGVVVATTKSIEDAVAGYLPLAGGTLTGPLSATGYDIHADGAYLLMKPLNGANLNQWRILSAVAGTNPGNLMVQSSPNAFASGLFPGFTIDPAGNMGVSASVGTAMPGGNNTTLVGAGLGSAPSIAASGADINVGMSLTTQGTGHIGLQATTNVTGDITATGNVNVQGTLSSTTNTQPAGITNSGVAIGGGPNYAIASFYDQALTANNRTAQEIFISGSMNFRFTNDAGSAATSWLTASGGYGSGITGITSNSGSGQWIHTGNFGTTGNQSVLPNGGNGIVVSGTNSAGVPGITTFGAANNISLSIATKGAGGINLQSNTTVSGTMNALSAVQVGGVNLLPVLVGATSSIGGSLLAAGACSTGTVAVAGATTAMGVVATPVTYPGAGATWAGYVSSTGTVTVTVCETVLGTPTASTYNVRVIQ